MLISKITRRTCCLSVGRFADHQEVRIVYFVNQFLKEGTVYWTNIGGQKVEIKTDKNGLWYNNPYLNVFINNPLKFRYDTLRNHPCMNSLMLFLWKLLLDFLLLNFQFLKFAGSNRIWYFFFHSRVWFLTNYILSTGRFELQLSASHKQVHKKNFLYIKSSIILEIEDFPK